MLNRQKFTRDDYFDHAMDEFPLVDKVICGVVITVVMALSKLLWPWKIEDGEKLWDDRRGRMIVMNHVSMFEPVAMYVYMYTHGLRCRFIYKSEFDKIGILSWLLSRAGAIPVERGTADLKAVGFDLMEMASNHCMDARKEGLDETLNVLDAVGLEHIGTYRTQEERDANHGLVVKELNGISIAFLDYTYGTNCFPVTDFPYATNLFFRDYLEMVAQWYADGLINPEFYTYKQNRNGSEAEAARVGDYCGVIGIDPNNLDYDEANAETPGYSLSAMAYPTVNPGETIHLAEYSNLTTPVISVTTDCEDVESVVTWLDWWYTDQGSDLANYGVEGLTMEYDENGEPYYTELYTQNDGSIISDDEFPQLYFFQVVSNVRIPTGVKSFYSEKAQSFPDVWTANQDTAWAMPPIALNEAEGELFSATFSDISTYFAQCLPQFAIGEKPVSEWDEFADTIQSMGIQDCIDCWQAALDRYNGKINVS